MIEGFKRGDRVRVPLDIEENPFDVPPGTFGTVITMAGLHETDNSMWVMWSTGKHSQVFPHEVVHAPFGTAAKPDAITPDHYKFGNVQVIDIIKYLPFNEGNVIKYVARADRKGNKLEDLRKAQKYLNLAIEIAEEEDGRNPQIS